MKRLLFLLFLLFTNCVENTDQKDKSLFVLPKYPDSTIKYANDPPSPPFILYPFYSDCNFIVDSTTIFYFQREKRGWLCGTGIDLSTPPDFIDLKPKDLIQIPASSIKAFIDLNILNNNPRDSRVVIGVPRDTINSAVLYEMMDIFKANRVRCLFRKTTQEESIVLDYKIRKTKYDYESIKWDLTKIHFLPTLEGMRKFKIPDINK